MDIEACDLFFKLDNLINDKFVHEGQFNNNSSLYNEFCPQGKNGVKKCNTDYERISAIAGYLFMTLIRSNKMNLNNDNNKYIKYFIMWISHKLYRIAANHIVTLNQSYEEHLGKSIGNFNFWNLLYNQKELKNANIAIMNMYYALFKQICETVKKYKQKDSLGHEYVNMGTQSYIIYDEISKFVKPCGTYLGLLDHLKTVYNDFVQTAISKNRYNESIRQQLIEFPPIDNANLGSNLKGAGCKKVHQRLIKKPPRIIRNEIKRLKADIKKNPQKEFKLIDFRPAEDEYYGEEDDDDDDDYDYDDIDDEDIDDDSGDDNEESGNGKLQDEQLEKKNTSIGPQGISQDSAKYNIPTQVTQAQSSGSASRDTATQSGKASIPSTPRNPPGKPESSVPPKQVDLKPVPAQTGTVKPTPPQPTPPQPIPSQSTPTQRTNLKSPSKQSAPEKQPLPAQKSVVKPATQHKAEQTQHQPQPKSAKPESPRSTKQPPNDLSSTTTGASITSSTPKKPENIKLALPEEPPQPQKEPKIPQSSKAASEKPVSAQTAAVKPVPAHQAQQPPTYPPNIKSPPEQSLPSPLSRQSPKDLPSTVSGTSTTPSTVSGTSTTPSTSTTTIPSIKRKLDKQNDTLNQISRVPTSGLSEGLINIPINGSGATRDQLSNQHSTTENSGSSSKKDTREQMNQVDNSPLSLQSQGTNGKTQNQVLESKDQGNQSKNEPSVPSSGSDKSPGTQNKVGNTQSNANTGSRTSSSSDISNQPQSSNFNQGGDGGGKEPKNDVSKQSSRSKRSANYGSSINTPTAQSGMTGAQSSVTAPPQPPVKPSNTGNGTTTRTDGKMNEKTSIWCIGSNKKCNII
ncbi:CIR protein, partial [Plasmodium chabaudi adami]